MSSIEDSVTEISTGQPTRSTRMAVFLVPFRAGRYALYCEPNPGGAAEDHAPGKGGPMARVASRMGTWLAEEERGFRADPPASTHRDGWMHRLRNRVVRWLTEVAAEQRLLWNLRRQDEATLVYPADLTEPRADALLRAELRRDADRHRRWLVVNAFGLAGSALLSILPGPNLLAYYFAFRVGGHYLSLRGARQGLRRVRWHTAPSVPLADLRGAAALSAAARGQLEADVASRLELSDLPAFFERIRLPGA